MPRRGRASAPPPRTVRAPARAAPARAAPPPAQVPAAAPPSAPAPMMAQSQAPSLMGQMAATAGGVAIGHTIGHAVTGLFSGGSNEPAACTAPAAAPMTQQSMPSAPQGDGACAWEIRQVIECAQNQTDSSLCAGFNEALRQCKMANI